MNTDTPYDLIAHRWNREFREKPFLDRFLDMATPGSHILDLGCGSGEPIARYLLERGFRVTGVDSSQEMLHRARACCPKGIFFLDDMMTVQLPETYHGIVAWDSLFHVPKSNHAKLFQAMSQWLEPNSPLLLSAGGSDGEFTAPMFGVDFFYNAHAPDVFLDLLRSTGFELVHSEFDDPSPRGHFVVICRKAARKSRS